MYFIANWKMFGVLNSLNSIHKVAKFLKNFKKNNSLKVIYCPPNTLIRPMTKKLKDTHIDVGAQNCHEHDKFGAFTGSVNSIMLKNVGAKYVIIGHSENRQAGESDKLINLKIKNAIKSGLKIIFCIGETLKEKRNKRTNSILNSQIVNGLKNIKKTNNIIFAYEPVWSIGTGLVPKNRDLEKQISVIKKIIMRFWKLKNPKIVYGGSVNIKNINNLKKVSSINGFLIGGASQNTKNFIDIIKKSIN